MYGARLLRSLVLIVTLTAAFLMSPSIAQAAIGDPTTGNLIYHGGPVMAGTMKAYAIFWEPPGFPVSARYNQLLKRYLRDSGHSALYRMLRQYPDAAGAAATDADLAGVLVDRSPYPSTPVLQDSDIRNEVVHAMSVRGWTPGIDHLFVVYTASTESVCAAFLQTCSPPAGDMCGYHFGFAGATGPVLYATLPYAGNSLARCYGVTVSPNHDAVADAEINITSHEQLEAATDPTARGWFGPGGITDEIGDKCVGVFGPLSAKGADIYVKGHPYLLQEEWDNTTSGCSLG